MFSLLPHMFTIVKNYHDEKVETNLMDYKADDDWRCKIFKPHDFIWITLKSVPEYLVKKLKGNPSTRMDLVYCSPLQLGIFELFLL